MEPSVVVERLWPGVEAAVEPLGGGITNHNFKVVVGGEAFVLRIGGKDTELLGIDRRDEHEASLAAARAGVAPEVVRFLEPEGYLVTRFVGGRPITPEELRRPVNLERAARLLRTVHEGDDIPARFDSFRVVCLAVGALAFIPMLQYAGAGIIAIAATGMIYLSYFVMNIALIRARLRGWPRAKAPFSLGRWAIPLNVLALAWGGGMLINFAWPRAATNPRPTELPGTLNFHWHWLNAKPVLWTVAITILLVGGAYFALVQRRKPAHLQAPEGEVFAAEDASTMPATAT